VVGTENDRSWYRAGWWKWYHYILHNLDLCWVEQAYNQGRTSITRLGLLKTATLVRDLFRRLLQGQKADTDGELTSEEQHGRFPQRVWRSEIY
jgi:hypothetical protein